MSVGRTLLFSAAAWAYALTCGTVWAQEVPPVRGADTENPSTASTNAPSLGTNNTLTATNALPEVVGPVLKPVEVVPDKPKDEDAMEAARQEAKLKALKEFGVIVRKDPFRLTPPPKIEKPAEIEEFIPAAAPKLQGIATFYNPPKAILRMSKVRGGNAASVFLGPEESKDGVEVLSIDLETSTVVVKVADQTYDLKLERAQHASKPASNPGNRFPPRGSRTSGSSRPGSSRNKPTGTRPSVPPKKPGGLKPVPTRPDASFRATPPQYELPAFNETIQRLAVEPSQISTQREMIHGQLNYTVPTDFPKEIR